MTNRPVFELLSLVQLDAVVGGDDPATACTRAADNRYDVATDGMFRRPTGLGTMALRLAPRALNGADRKAALDKAWDDSRAGIGPCIKKVNAGLAAGLTLDQMKPEKM